MFSLSTSRRRCPIGTDSCRLTEQRFRGCSLRLKQQAALSYDLIMDRARRSRKARLLVGLILASEFLVCPAFADFLPVPPPPPVMPFNFNQVPNGAPLGPFPPQPFPGQQQLGNRCATEAGVCPLQGPLGAPCSCMTSYGPINGLLCLNPHPPIGGMSVKIERNGILRASPISRCLSIGTVDFSSAHSRSLPADTSTFSASFSIVMS